MTDAEGIRYYVLIFVSEPSTRRASNQSGDKFVSSCCRATEESKQTKVGTLLRRRVDCRKQRTCLITLQHCLAETTNTRTWCLLKFSEIFLILVRCTKQYVTQSTPPIISFHSVRCSDLTSSPTLLDACNCRTYVLVDWAKVRNIPARQ